MARDNFRELEVDQLTAADLTRLEGMVKELTASVAAQQKFVEKHTAAMEKLTLAMKQLDQTLKKEINLESRQSNLQLSELINLFLEYDINPQFYHEHKALKAAPPPASKNTALVKRKPTRK
jgi:hypothetical protein